MSVTLIATKCGGPGSGIPGPCPSHHEDHTWHSVGIRLASQSQLDTLEKAKNADRVQGVMKTNPKIELVPIGKLVATQKRLAASVVESYRGKPLPEHGKDKGTILGIRLGGNVYIDDGHHRIFAGAKDGLKAFKMDVIDLDVKTARIRTKLRIVQNVVKAATELINLREKKLSEQLVRDRAMKVHDSQSSKLQDKLAAALEPMFKKQIESAASKLETGYSRSTGPFNPRDWDEELVNRALPPIAQAMAESMMAQAIQLHTDLKKHKKSLELRTKCGGPGSGVPGPCPTKPKEESHPDKEYGVRPVLSDKMKENLKKHEALILEKTSKDGNERGVGLEKDGSTSFSDKGDHHSINVLHGQFDKIVGGAYTHTHPSDSSFSGADLKLARAYELSEMRAVTKTGVFVVGPPEGGWRSITRSLFEKEVDQQYKTGARFSNMNVIPLVEKYGLHYRFDPHQTPQKSYEGTKASTATEWLDSLDDEDAPDLEDVVFKTPYGNVTMKLAVDYPDWMKDKIQERLDETFSQPYWKEINDTTGGTIDGFLSNSLKDGLSIEDMAKKMLEEYGDEYPKSRGRNIARTEAGNALNGARSDAIDGLIQDLGLEESVKKIWLSILGNTTRDSHAHLHLVPADENGCWYLSGICARWPGDTRLGPGERCNCQCTVSTAFGMLDDEAQERIADYQLRMQKMASFDYETNVLTPEGSKVFCPTGPGGGVDPHCGGGGLAKDAGGYNPGVVGAYLGVDTSKWKKSVGAAQWALQKINRYEELAKKGKFIMAIHSFYENKPGYTDKYTLAVMQAQKNVKILYDEKLGKLPQGAKPSGVPNVASGEGWKKISDSLGTEKGGVYEMGGKKYYVKQPDNMGRAHNELLAYKLYAAVGASAKDASMVMIDGKPALATEWVNSVNKHEWSPGQKKDAQEDFAVHVWLNNWDAVGANKENIQFKSDGKPVLIDAGGSMDYHSHGGGGKKPFTKDPVEWNTLRNPNINPNMAYVFGGMTPQQLHASTQKLKSITDEQILEHVYKYGGKKTGTESLELAQTLIARKHAILLKGKEIEELEAAEKAKQEHLKVIAALPPPPNVLLGKKETDKHFQWWHNYQSQFDYIAMTAKDGNKPLSDRIKLLNQVKVKENPKDPYLAKLWQYKVQTLAVLNGATPQKPATTNPDHVVKPSGKLAPPKVDPSKFPEKPKFIQSNKAQVALNEAVVSKALEHANKGDLFALQNMTLTPSPKLKAWHSELVSHISEVLNPTPPPVALSGEYSALAAKITPKHTAGMKKLGYWSVLGVIPDIPNGIVKSSWKANNEKLWADGSKAIISGGLVSVVKSYTASGYGQINDSLRGGVPTSSALKLANGIMKHGIELPVGQTIGRRHPNVGFSDWSTVKPGDVIAEKGILSTSVSEHMWSGNTHLVMAIGPGVKGLPVKSHSSNSSENEVLLAPNQKIMVTRIEKKPHGTTVHAVLLPTDPAQCCPP